MIESSDKRIWRLAIAAWLCLAGWSVPANAAMWQWVHSEQQGLAHRVGTALPELELMPDQYQMYRMDESQIQQRLQDPSANIALTVPLPNGEMTELLLRRSQVMEDALANQRPDIMTFSASGITDPLIHGTLDHTPKGFHGLLSTPQGTVYIDPRGDSADRYYLSYFQKDYRPDGKQAASCGVDPALHHQQKEQPSLTSRFVRELAAAFTTGSRVREYRIAVAATAEYTAFHNDPASGMSAQDDALNAIVTTINRVNFFLQRDFAARLTVVADNRDIIFTDSATDGLSNGQTNTLLSQVQPILDQQIGFDNYDVGHVFHVTSQFTSSGIAYVGIVCDPRTNPFQGENRKGQGVSGSWRPTGDSFDVELVAHEIGHQFGANHTFNSTRGTCSGARTQGSAFEPGSGSTIMSYPGSCGTDNLQSGPDYMFSSNSMQQVADEFNNGWGNLCDLPIDEGNSEPSAIAVGTWQIPAHTPFELTGTGVDNDIGDVLTYSWEQTDSGDASSVDVDTGNNAIFRAFLPVSSAVRTFPRLSSILSSSTITGEHLPTTTRQLNFRLTVRDQRGGTDDANVVVNVTDTDPSDNGFRITSLNTAQTLTSGSLANLTWNTVSTQNAPINCSNVSVFFSSDGGLTFPTTIEPSITNDGSAQITVPAILTTQGRIKLQCANNIFFDINNANLTIGNVPEIQVSGNGQEISDGTTSTSAANNTDFGVTSIGSATQNTIDKVFVIDNLGNEPLSLTGNPRVELVAGASAGFSVIDQPAASIGATSSDSFTIRFSRTSQGVGTATVRILNNDGDEASYTFNIRGTASRPEISVRGNNIVIADGDTLPISSNGTFFDAVNVNGTIDQVFNIRNSSPAVLDLSGNPRISISGINASDFSVVENADRFTAQSNITNNFTIRFTPSGSGFRNAMVSIANNDANENPYNFAIVGDGLSANLQATMQDSPDPVNPGEPLSYSVTVANLSDDPALAAVVTFNTGSGVVVTSTSGCSESPAAGSTCTLGTVTANSQRVVTFNTTVSAAARNSVSSSVSVASQTFDPASANNTDTESTSVVLLPPQFSMSAIPSMVLQGESGSLVMTVNNSSSNTTVTGLGMSLSLPAGMEVANPSNISTSCSGSVVANPGQSQMNFGSGTVAAGQSCQFRFDVTSAEAGVFNIVTSALTSSAGNSGTASADIEFVEELVEDICMPIRAANGSIAIICL